MTSSILKYCEKNGVSCIFLDFFGTIVKRDCGPEEIKFLWAKTLAHRLKYAVDEEQLIFLRKKSEKAVITRAESGEFNYIELCDEIFRRIIKLDSSFGNRYSVDEFYKISHDVEIQVELMSQSFFSDTIRLIQQAQEKGIRINVISDFYLGQADLRIFLSKEKAGQKVDHIFVSSDYRTSKHLGGLYKRACEQLGISSKQCIMVGDNLKVDVQNAERFGIKGFLVNQSEGERSREKLELAITEIAKSNISGMLGYSNYCFLLFLYAERLYKTLIREGVQHIYFLSREGEFLKKLFDLYLSKRKEEEICTHYLYVSRKATYPATLKPLDNERFSLLRKYAQFSISDFLENIGMSDAVTKLGLEQTEVDQPIDDFFNSPAFYKLCSMEDFQTLYEDSRTQYRARFKRYCEQEGLLAERTIAIADVGWSGTMQDNICSVIGNANCLGVYIGVINSAYISSKNKKLGLIFSENPVDSKDLSLWSYDHVFLERILCASHGATDHYEGQEGNTVSPVLKEYTSEVENYERIKPVQSMILQKFVQLCDCFKTSCYSAENLYELFLNVHLRTIFVVNNKQLELQKNTLKGQMQNFGHLTTAGDSIKRTFSKTNIIRKAWHNLRVLKNKEVMFRILLNYNQKMAIRLIYYAYYAKMCKKRKM